MKFLAIFPILAAAVSIPIVAHSQEQSESALPVAFCDPLMSEDRLDLEDDDRDEEELEIDQTYRYDLEEAEPLTTREDIMNALFEEKWNFETKDPIARRELCDAEENYVVLWSKLLAPMESGEMSLDAEGYTSIRKDGTFQFVFAERPYSGNWELDGVEMVLTADWLNEGAPYRNPVEFVRTPVETVAADGDEYSFVDEMYRLGGFRFYRIPTTVKGRSQNCSCENIDR